MGLGEWLGRWAGAVSDALKHSFPPVVDAGTRLLVLGSLPGERSLAAREYYAHPQNQFWRLMAPVIGREDLPALPYLDRLEASLAAGVGLWDVVARARRQGSSDAAIREMAGNDLPALLDTLPAVRAIGFNGGTALRHGQALLGDRAERWTLVALPSSSPLHTIGLEAKRGAWMRLRDFLD